MLNESLAGSVAVSKYEQVVLLECSTLAPPLSPLILYPSTFHNGEPAKLTLLPSKHVLNRADVADWVLVAPHTENRTVSKISN